MAADPKHYLFVEQPERQATIDFAEFHTKDGTKVEELTVKLTVEYDEFNEEATLHVYAACGENARIVIDCTRGIDTTAPEDEEGGD